MKSISVQYQELKEGKMNKNQFLRNARMMFPNFVTNHNSFDDSVKILKNKGLLNEGDAVKGVPDKAPTYDYPTQPGKYKKVIQEPEVDEQDGIYPATTVTDIPKEEVSKPIKSKNRPDGLEPIKNRDTKNEMKKVRLVRESKKNLTENQVTPKQIQDKYNEMFGKNPQTTFADVAKALGISEQEIAMALLFKGNMPGLREAEEIKINGKIVVDYKQNGDKSYSVEFEDGSKQTIAVSNDNWDTINNTTKKLEEPSTIPGSKMPVGPKTLGRANSFLSQFRSPDASGPGQSLNTLKAKIKEIVREIVDEIGPAGMEAAGNPEEEKGMRDVMIRKEYEIGDESDDAPSIAGAIDSVVEFMEKSIESNDLGLKWTEKDLIDVFYNFQDRIGHRYSDEEFEKIIDGAIDKLKLHGYNLTK